MDENSNLPHSTQHGVILSYEREVLAFKTREGFLRKCWFHFDF